jgi:hypothetical protein
MNEIALRLAARLFDQRLIENPFRSAFVQAMIEPYLRLGGWRYAGDGWSGWDFERADGKRLEVKQSAAHQTWSDPRRLRTRGSFDIAERTGASEKGGPEGTGGKGRPADVYVFAWNGAYGEATDHRDPAQWLFYVIPTAHLPAAHRTISLARVQAIAETEKPGGPVAIEALMTRVSDVLANLEASSQPQIEFPFADA